MVKIKKHEIKIQIPFYGGNKNGSIDVYLVNGKWHLTIIEKEPNSIRNDPDMMRDINWVIQNYDLTDNDIMWTVEKD